MKVLHTIASCHGPILLDISTVEKELAAYLYMFRWVMKHTALFYKVEHHQKTIEGYHLTIGEIKKSMAEMILLHGKERITNFLQEKRRAIKDYREMISSLEVIGPLYDRRDQRRWRRG